MIQLAIPYLSRDRVEVANLQDDEFVEGKTGTVPPSMRLCIDAVPYSSLHLDITLPIPRSRVTPKLHRSVLRTHAVPTIQHRTGSGLMRGSILARFALAFNFRRQRRDVTYADLGELREVLVTGRTQGKPRPTLLVLQNDKFQITCPFSFSYV